MSSLHALKSIFGNVLALSAADRAAYLDTACAGDTALRAELEEMLEAHVQAKGFLQFGMDDEKDTPFPIAHGNSMTKFWEGLTLPQPPSPLSSGTVLAHRYQLVEPIGEGGMGCVWLANQTEAVRRQVAVKLVKDGMDTHQVLARFDAERQALARMDHPNIAKVLDAGSTSDGRPFFVMELVRGIPITRFCDGEKLTPHERLALFVPVCQAIQHAHQKGIIHRDIKPSNVLVALYDGKPVPKVIDFGVAKATDSMLTDMTLHTGLMLVGTPEYMAPEQVELNRGDVDTRTDVYGLGALLYELLTGTPPIARGELEGAGLLEVLQAVRQHEPTKPSTRLSGSGTLMEIAAQRGMEPRRLWKLVRGDLDWIVMRTLEKDRNRRYETANGLALDIERYLAGETVQAVPPSSWYRTRKFVRRNRGAVAAAIVLLLALGIGSVGTTVGLFQAAKALEEAKAARKEAIEEKNRANDRATIARAVSDFLQKDLLLQADSFHQAFSQERVNPKLTVREALDRAAKLVNERFQDQPRAEAEVELAIGQAYAGLQENTVAVTHLERAVSLLASQLGAEDPETINATTQLGLTLLHIPKRREEATALLVRAEKVTRDRLGDDDLDTVRATYHVGTAYLSSGDLEKARPLLEWSRERTRAKAGPDHEFVADTESGLAQVYERQDLGSKALELRKDVLRIRTLRLPPDHPDISTAKCQLGLLYHSQKQLSEAEQLLTEAFEGRLKVLGVAHPWTWHSARELAAVLYEREEFDRAFEYAERALHGTRRTEGVGSPAEKIVIALVLRARNAQLQRKPELIPTPDLKYLNSKYERLKAELGPSDYATRSAMTDLAKAYQSTGQPAKALPLLEEVLRLALERDGADDVHTHAAMHLLGLGYQEAGHLSAAISLLEDTVAKTKHKLGLNHANTPARMYSLARAYLEARRDADALPLFNQALAIQRKNSPKDDRHFNTLLIQTATDLLDAGKFAAAEPYLRECLENRKKSDAENWVVPYTQALLGASLCGQAKYDEAELLLLNGHRDLQKLKQEIPYDRWIILPETADRLIELYTASKKADQVAVWRAIRSAHATSQTPAPRLMLK